jgi:hypothetical protein
MVRDRADRTLATVLFVDIVDSTRLAAEVGDRRWREILGAFRQAVRRRLKEHRGREQDTAGDGFFATFERPAGAVRAGAAIIADAQRIGFEVRCGLHTGELERIDGRLGGIAAHIGARVMALAEPAEALMTATVHDMVVGSDVASDVAIDTELKGVPGSWTLYRISAVDGIEIPAPLGTSGVDRINVPRPGRRNRAADRRPALLGIAAVGALILFGGWALALTLLEDRSVAGAPSPSPSRPPSMIKIDATTGEVLAEVHDKYLPLGIEGRALVVDGTLWQETPINLVRRDLESGEALDVIDKPTNAYTHATWFGFGSIWFGVPSQDLLAYDLERVDPLSGRTLARVSAGQQVRDIAFGRNAIFFLTKEGEVIEVDPEQNAITDRDVLPLDTVPDAIRAVGGNVWICECDEGRIVQFDPQQDEVVRTVEFAQRGFILGDARELTQGSVTTDSSTVWLMDGDAGTITPVDATTGEAGQPIGIPQYSSWHDFGGGAIWIASWPQVYRLDLETGEGQTIDLPHGVYGGGIAVDEATNAVWLANFVPSDQ